MRIFCPRCSTLYDVPEAALGAAGRRLRCERCGHEWRWERARPAATPIEPPPEAPPHEAPAAPGTWEPEHAEQVAPAELGFVPSEATDRRFGQADDDEADAQMRAAAARETPAPASDGFDELMQATRAKTSRPPPPPPRRSPAPRIIALLLLLVLVLIVFEHQLLVRAFPGMAPFFRSLGLGA